MLISGNEAWQRGIRMRRAGSWVRLSDHTLPTCDLEVSLSRIPGPLGDKLTTRCALRQQSACGRCTEVTQGRGHVRFAPNQNPPPANLRSLSLWHSLEGKQRCLSRVAGRSSSVSEPTFAMTLRHDTKEGEPQSACQPEGFFGTLRPTAHRILDLMRVTCRGQFWLSLRATLAPISAALAAKLRIEG